MYSQINVCCDWLVSGLLIIVGDAYYISLRDQSKYTDTDTMTAGLMCLLSGIFAILDMCGVKSR